MPRPRFQNLAQDKRHRILQAAAREFAAYGYENASLNRILEAAEISKGAAYYYFDDKADVFATTLEYFSDHLSASFAIEAVSETISTEAFWRFVESLYTQRVHWADEHPYLVGLIHAAWNLTAESLAHAQLRARYEALRDTAMRVIVIGQHIGAIRTDLPTDLLAHLVFNFDSASHGWFAENRAQHSTDTLHHIARQLARTLQRALEPPPRDEPPRITGHHHQSWHPDGDI